MNQKLYVNKCLNINIFNEITYLEINLTKEVQEWYSENYKTLRN